MDSWYSQLFQLQLNLSAVKASAKSEKDHQFSVLISQLQPKTMYKVRVAAQVRDKVFFCRILNSVQNRFGQSVPTKPIILQTKGIHNGQ